VEFAIAVPFLFMLIFGMIEISRAFMVSHILTEIARRSCREAVAIHAPNNTNAYITASVINPLLDRHGIRGATVEFFVTPYGAAQSTVPADISTAASYGQSTGGGTVPGSMITVRIRVPVGNASWTPPYFTAGRSLQGEYTLRRE